jgi:hypothetical protein
MPKRKPAPRPPDGASLDELQAWVDAVWKPWVAALNDQKQTREHNRKGEPDREEKRRGGRSEAMMRRFQQYVAEMSARPVAERGLVEYELIDDTIRGIEARGPGA